VTIAIRRADLERDKSIIIDALFRNLTPASDERRFNWLYLQNPKGPAQAWLAVDDGNIVGVSAAFARDIQADGAQKTGWVLGDFCVAEKYRSLGPALQLQRATLDAVKESRQAKFCYDFPSRSLMAIYRRLGIEPTGKMVRLARPIRVDRKLEQLTGSTALAKSAGWIGNLFLQAADLTMAGSKGYKLAIHEGECGSEFTELCARQRKQGITLARSAAYLNWRYVRHPLTSYRILTALRESVLEGYLIFSCAGEDAYIAEWCVGSDSEVVATLISDLVRRLRSDRIMTLSAFLMESDPRFLQLAQLGFRPRESTDVVVFWPGKASTDLSRWQFMYGDRDV
jgi:hypothetical protein